MTVVLAPSSSPVVDVRLVLAARIAKGPHVRAEAQLRAGGATITASFNLDVSVFKTRELASDSTRFKSLRSRTSSARSSVVSGSRGARLCPAST
ncbi:hypothetical protein [Nannocystis radixulma]|uniref:Uncharacterized protein n=1 Tax=Nannocystis radixulma TaxID=2995305 RepID=A0ABT5B913_9BACT|nr:hypothetical protein [Nannocystis radixulma]MDC0670620.1 hypothetical protein [Nannocystis radixulma]